MFFFFFCIFRLDVCSFIIYTVFLVLTSYVANRSSVSNSTVKNINFELKFHWQETSNSCSNYVVYPTPDLKPTSNNNHNNLGRVCTCLHSCHSRSWWFSMFCVYFRRQQQKASRARYCTNYNKISLGGSPPHLFSKSSNYHQHFNTSLTPSFQTNMPGEEHVHLLVRWWRCRVWKWLCLRLSQSPMHTWTLCHVPCTLDHRNTTLWLHQLQYRGHSFIPSPPPPSPPLKTNTHKSDRKGTWIEMKKGWYMCPLFSLVDLLYQQNCCVF